LKIGKSNRKEHVATVREARNYSGDLLWTLGGDENSTVSSGELCIDGAGATRSYNHRHRGKQSAFNAISMVTGKPLGIVVSQVSKALTNRCI
jgi:hypothetical protein